MARARTAGTTASTAAGTTGRTAGRAPAADRAARPARLQDPGGDDSSWVDAGPFRAHVRHLMAVGSLEVTEVAVVLGLSTRAVRHLLEGRSGRLPRRISPEVARCLLLVDADDVRGLRWCITPAGGARHALQRLLEAGWSLDEVAGCVGFALGDLHGLQTRTRCNRLLSVRLVGLARGLSSTVDDQDLVPLSWAA